VLQRKTALAIIGTVCVAAIVGILFIPPIAQPLDYHEFADARTLFGVPNFWNVMSNVPFLLVGILGLVEVVRNKYAGGLPSQRFAYGVFFAGVAVVCLGSGYYHWSPSNATLAWDRLPMAVAFMAFVSIVVSEHIDEHVGKALLWPLIVVGVASVWYWDYTEALGRGDLRPYGLVQFLSLVVIALTWILIPSRLSGIGYLWAMFAGYALAKVLEEFDDRIFSVFGQHMSGHALKHTAAAAGMYCFVLALRRRRIAVA
jgi:hypothetical protein